jgi:hypothetical protein
MQGDPSPAGMDNVIDVENKVWALHGQVDWLQQRSKRRRSDWMTKQIINVVLLRSCVLSGDSYTSPIIF